jgi:hypothetical protein
MTLTELNKKWWYRLIKVVYVLLFALVLCFSVAIVVGEGPAITDPAETIVVCNPDQAPIFRDAPQNKLTAERLEILVPGRYVFENGALSLEKYFQSYRDGDIRRIFAACGGAVNATNDTFDIYVQQRLVEMVARNRQNEQASSSVIKLSDDDITELERIENSVDVYEKSKYVTFKPRPFDIIPGYDYYPLIKAVTLTILLVVLIFEALRRLFYYVVTGRLRPQRDEL